MYVRVPQLGLTLGTLSQHVCMYAYIHILTSIHKLNTHTHIHTYKHTHIQTYTHIHIHTYTLTHIHTYTHTHIHTYTCTHVHTYTHTHMQP